MFETISPAALIPVTGGHGTRCKCCAAQPQTPDNYNTGITGGMDVPNNQVPPPSDPGFNTGITGGMKVPNNQVPRPRRRY